MTDEKLKLELVEGEYTKLDVHPGDTLVVKLSGQPSIAVVERVQDILKAALPKGVKVLVTPPGIEFTVVRKES